MGETRANTRVCCVAFCHQLTISGGSSSVKLSVFGTRDSSIAPVMTEKSSAPWSCSHSWSAVLRKMLMRLAMARAVSGWSPVTMTTFTPAFCARTTASATPSLGGSSMPNRPTNSKSFIGKLQSVGPVPSNFAFSGISSRDMRRLAMQRTRRAWPIRSAIWDSICAMAAPSFETVQNLSTRSGAPLRMANMLPRLAMPCTVSIHLFSELNGISKILSFSRFARVLFTAPAPPWTSMLAR
mmetsp:Transcript_19927/g.59641  ORF Transcript_19927/g.59641 Transcript_19927/m.59641 type:complete len:239 (-) Transcript_19927:929-1645(-)